MNWDRFREKEPNTIHYKISSMRNRNVTLALKYLAIKNLESYNSMTDTQILSTLEAMCIEDI